jgi:hypothetical protein
MPNHPGTAVGSHARVRGTLPNTRAGQRRRPFIDDHIPSIERPIDFSVLSDHAEIMRVAAASFFVLVGSVVAFALTALNGAETDERRWSWGLEAIYLVVLAIWCLGWILFAERWSQNPRLRFVAPVVVLGVSVIGWVVVFRSALSHPK